MTQTERPSPNHELFVHVLAQIEREPETWDQTSWVNLCGTAFCMAGHAAHMTGAVFCKPNIYGDVESVRTERGGSTRIWLRACRDLGIDYGRHGERLFDGSNSLDDLYRISAEILGIDETVLREKVAAEIANGQVQQ